MRKLLAFVFVFVSLYSFSQATVVPICGGTSATIQATNPNSLSGPTYSLNPGGFSPLPGTADFVVSPPVTTNYTLYTTGQNTNNVTVTNSIVIQVSITPQPAVSPSFTQATCTNSLNTVNLGLTFNPATPATSNFTVTWLPLPPASVLTAVQTTATAFSPGPYTVQVVAPGGCSVQTTFTMNPQPAPANFSVIPYGNTHSITCLQPTLVLNATNPAFNYTWSSTSSLPVQNDSISLNNTNLGTISLLGQNPTSGCTATYTFAIVQNISTPSATLSANSIVINCTQTAAPTLSVISSPSVNISNYIYSPSGGTFVANSYTTIMQISGGVGVYTHVAMNDANGCTSGMKTFTVTSNDDYPVMTVISPNSFTLGCSTKSVGNINIVNPNTTNPPGGAISFTVLQPGFAGTLPPGSLSGSTSYTVNVPGTWTVVVRDDNNGCVTQVPVSVLQRTLGPVVLTAVPRQILDCTYSITVLQGASENSNVGYNWGFNNPGGPGNVSSASITALANFAASTQTLLNNYTLTVTDNINLCKTATIVPIYQNLFTPSVIITGASSITCNTPTLTLSHLSTSNIPPFFPHPLGVIGFLWQGPTPQVPLQVSSSYVAGIRGTYTLTAKDPNNGCVATGTAEVQDKRDAPIVTAAPEQSIVCGASATLKTELLGSQGTPTYSWIPPVGSGSTSPNSGKELIVISPGSYTVIITNPLTGCKTTTAVTAKIGTLTAQLRTDQTSGYAPLTINFTNSSYTSKDSSGIFSFWNYGNGLKQYVNTPATLTVPIQTTYKQPGTYTVTMFAVKGTCMDTAYTVIHVEVPAVLEIPNVFTPNGDDVNDFFFLKATNLSDINMTIFDRWGHLVYELKTDKGNVSWDGKNQLGNEMAEGTYFYVIKATGKDGQTWDKKGTVSLFR